MSIEKPDYHSHEEFINRSKKLKEIRDLGINPYPHSYSLSNTIETIQNEFKDKEIGHSDDAASGSTKPIKIAGRLVLFRSMGKNAFAQIQDETGRIQIMFNRDLTEVEGYDPEKDPNKSKPIKFIEKKIDLGDFIGIEGHIFRTQKGELTVFAKKATLLCKSLLPLPDKHSGLADKGIRYRKRWLDLISTKETTDTFILRSKVIKAIRKYLDNAGFLEVETPILQNSYGGAEAKPFTTVLNALKQEMFLRISLEIPLKKLIVGGHLKVYELGKVFRNEGIDRTHNPEFTELEAYSAYWDYNDLMSFVENMYEKISLDLLGTTKISIPQKDTTVEVNLKAPWIRISMKDSIKKYAGIDIDSLSDEEIKTKLIKEAKLPPSEVNKKPRGLLIAMVFEEYVEEHLIQPHHITDHPIETTPLCKPHRNPENHKELLVERFESFIMGKEILNAYTELNDPELQRHLLELQAEKKLQGDEEASPLDEEFVEAICQGMPPTGGFGIGVDRMVMLFAKALSIKDVLYFPLMKPED